MSDENASSQRRRVWAVFVAGGFIGASLTYYLGEPVVWALAVLAVIAVLMEGWRPLRGPKSPN